jgi:putative aldouronate transport system substrate-binding protein
VLYAFTYNDPDGNGVNDTFGLCAQAKAGSFASIFGAYGIPCSITNNYSVIIQDDNTVTIWVKHPNFLESIKYIRQLIKDGLVEPDWLTISQIDMFGKLWTGVAGAIDFQCVGPTNNWMPARYTENPPPTFGFPVITGPYGDHGTAKRFSSVTEGYVITAAADVAACMRIADYCKTLEGNSLLHLGVEGVMYKWIDKGNGVFEYLGDYVDSTVHRNAGGYVYSFLFQPKDNAEIRTLNTQTREGVAQAWNEGLDNTANIVATLQTRTDYGADMDQVIAEMYAELLSTTGDLQAIYDSYIAEWEKIGGSEWEIEVNKAWVDQGSSN